MANQEWDYSGEIPRRIEQPKIEAPTQGFKTPGGATITQQGIQDVGYKAATGIMGAPVDLVNMFLAPLGLDSKTPVMGSDWMNQQAAQAGIISNPEVGAGDILTSLAIPDPLDIVQFTKYATDVVPAMFVAAKSVDGNYPTGSFSDIASKETMQEISDIPAETPRFKRTINDVFYDLDTEAFVNEGSPAGSIYKEELQKISKLKNKSQDEILQEHEKIQSQINTIIETSDLNDPKTYDKLKEFVDQREPYSALIGHMEKRSSGKLKDFLKHDELYKLYPELEYLHVRVDPNIDVSGYYTKGNAWQGEQIVLKNENDLSTLLHEVQHKIQKEENFPRGGNTKQFEGIVKEYPNILEKHSFLQEMKRVKKENPGADLSALHNLVVKDYQDMDMLDMLPSRENRDWVMDNLYDKEATDKINKEFEMLKGASTNPDAKEFYNRLWGEQQSRATEYRKNMTPEERQSESWQQTLERKEVGGYRNPIIQRRSDEKIVTPNMSENKLGFLERKRAETQAKIDKGEIPEVGRTVVSPYDNKKQYYLGESGKVYFQRANGTWRQTENYDTVKDVKYVAENGLSNFKKMINEEDLKFEKALEESKLREAKANETYKMTHTAPTSKNGASANNITDFFPNDIFSKDAARLYGHGNKTMDEESIKVIRKVKDNPEAEVTIYRAVPKDLDVEINPNDWVTTSKLYAKEHGEGPLKGDYKILEKKVKAKDIYTDGNSIHEWGWSPSRTTNQYNEGDESFTFNNGKEDITVPMNGKSLKEAIDAYYDELEL